MCSGRQTFLQRVEHLNQTLVKKILYRIHEKENKVVLGHGSSNMLERIQYNAIYSTIDFVPGGVMWGGSENSFPER